MTALTVVPVASALHGAEAIQRIIDGVQHLLGRLTVTWAEPGPGVSAADPSTPLAVLVVTGGTERAVLDAWDLRQHAVPGEPLLLLAHPDHNSLPAALEALAALQRRGARGRIVALGDRTDPAEAVDDVAAWHALHRARIGQVGEPSDWLVASVPDPSALARRWGPLLVPVDIAPAVAAMAAPASGEVSASPIAVPVEIGHHHHPVPTAEDVAHASRFEPILRDLADAHRLDAVSVRCFDLVTGAGTSGCLALAALNDTGLVAGCEGDVASTVALLWVRHLLHSPGWMANPAAVDTATGTLELAHCTIAPSLVSGLTYDTHFESGLGVGIVGTFPPGPVTLVRLGGADLDRLWCVDGEALPTERRPERCRTQVDVRIDPAEAAAMLERPLGNHLVVVPGHHADRLRRWFAAFVA